MMKRLLLLLLLPVLLHPGCRPIESEIPPQTTDVGSGESGEIAGFFLLNEGNMGSNKCTLDYYDYASGIYMKNIYAERNPGLVQELGYVAKIDTTTLQVVDTCVVGYQPEEMVITGGTDAQFQNPYGIAVNPNTHEIFVSDARDYITPGKIYCYSPEGRLKWSANTGDIPSRIVFTRQRLQ